MDYVAVAVSSPKRSVSCHCGWHGWSIRDGQHRRRAIARELVKHCIKGLTYHTGRSSDHEHDADLDEGLGDGSCGRVVVGSRRSGS